MFCPPNIAVPVKAGLTRGAYPVRLGIWLVVAMLCPPNAAIPVNAGQTRGAYPVRLAQLQQKYGIIKFQGAINPPDIFVKLRLAKAPPPPVEIASLQ